MAILRRIAWADFPLDIVDQILEYCDNSSLLVLGRANHQLNLRALSRYFTQQIIGDHIHLPDMFSFGKFPLDTGGGDEVMRSLLVALWLPKSIQHIDYRLAPYAEYGRYINHLLYLAAFIHRMPKLTSLRVNSGFIKDGRFVNERSHYSVWDELLAAASSKGCEILEVKESGISITGQSFSPLERLYTCIFGRGSTLRSAVIPLYPNSSFSSSRRTTAVVQQALREIQIDGYTFRSPPLLLHIILTQHAVFVTRLSLMNMNIRPQKKLKKILDRVQFAALKSFTFSNGWPVSPIVFLRFLSRHPTLAHLNLDSEILRYVVQPPQKWSSLLSFPDLQHLEMFPEALHWLVPDFRRCPNLHSITLKGDLWSYRDAYKTSTLPGIIKSILDNLHNTPSMTWALKVEIALPLENSSWLSNLYDTGESETHLRWWRVKDLKVQDIRERLNYDLQLDVLVNWLATFPSLEHLEVDPVLCASEEEFVELVAAKCPNLRSFGLPYYPTFYGRPGRERKLWVVQGGRVSSHIIRYSGWA